MGNTLFGRYDQDKVRTVELNILAHHLLPNSGVDVNIPYFVWRHLTHTAHTKLTQLLLLGGLIVFMAKKTGWVENPSRVFRQGLLGKDHLLICVFLNPGLEEEQIDWVVEG